MFVLLFLTPVFSKLPYNVIGAIIIVGVCQLIEFGVAYHLFKVRRGQPRARRRRPPDFAHMAPPHRCAAQV